MLLQANKVTHYFGGLCAVSDFNLNLEKGELVGVIGPNGAGKTTVFNLITGVYKASHGSIQIEALSWSGSARTGSPTWVLPAPFRTSASSKSFRC